MGCQVRQQNRERLLAVVIERESRSGQCRRPTQLLDGRVVFAQGQKHVGGRRPRLRRDWKQVGAQRKLPVITLPRLQVTADGLLPVSDTVGGTAIASIQWHSEPVHDIGVLRGKLVRLRGGGRRGCRRGL